MSEDINPLAPAEDAEQEETQAEEPEVPGNSNPAEYSVEVVSVEGAESVQVTPERHLAVDQRHPNPQQGGLS